MGNAGSELAGHGQRLGAPHLLLEVEGVLRLGHQALPRFLELLGHAIERLGHLAQLVETLHGQRRTAPAFPEGADGVGQVGEGAQDLALQHHRDEQSEGDGEGAHAEEDVADGLAGHLLGVGSDEGDLEGPPGGRRRHPAPERRVPYGQDVHPPVAALAVRLDKLSRARLDDPRHHVRAHCGMGGGLDIRDGEHLSIAVEETDPVDPFLSNREVVEEVDELGLRPPTHGQGTLHRDLDRAHHSRGARLLVFYPRPRFLLYADHAVDADHEEERQHQQQDQAEPQFHGLRRR